MMSQNIFLPLLKDTYKNNKSTPKGRCIDLPLEGAVGYTLFEICCQLVRYTRPLMISVDFENYHFSKVSIQKSKKKK